VELSKPFGSETKALPNPPPRVNGGYRAGDHSDMTRGATHYCKNSLPQKGAECAKEPFFVFLAFLAAVIHNSRFAGIK
jgi:hypothetical protein